MIISFRDDDLVLCAIRGKSCYIASLDRKTRGIPLQCKWKRACTKEMGLQCRNKTRKEAYNEACEKEIRDMDYSNVLPYLFTVANTTDASIHGC